MGALAGILLLASPARSEEKVNMTSETDAGRALCELLDLERPELAAVKDCVDREDFNGALTAYRDRIVDLGAALDLGEPPGFWLWTATDADDLLQAGI